MENEIYEFKNKKNIYLPKTCPHCHREILPNVITEYCDDTSGSLFCNCDLCKKTFLIYVEKLYKSPKKNNIVIYPRSIDYLNLSDIIYQISSRFVDIYNQAMITNNMKLNLVSGPAFRKAFEYLVKDYAIYKNPKSANKIKSYKVIKVINEFLNFEPLNLLLEASNIIGNDETHYEKRYDELSVEELIQFINSIIKYIDYEHSISQAHNVVIQHHSDNPKNQPLRKDT